MRFLLLLLCPLAVLSAAQAWEVHGHPAPILREFTAYTRPWRELRLAAEVAGRIEQLQVEAGDRISGVEPAIRLEARQAELARQAAADAVAVAQGRLQQAEAVLALAARQQRYEQDELKRVESLAERGQAAEQELDALRLRADTAAIEHRRAQADVDLQQAAVAQARTQLDQADDHLMRHRIWAPADWRVVQRQRQVGSVVAPGEPILHLVDTTQLLLPLRLGPAELRALRALERIELHFPDTDQTVAARIRQVAADFDAVSRKRLVELLIDGSAAPEASGGLEARLRLPVADPNGALLLPTALTQRVGEQVVVRCSDGRKRTVTVLRRLDDDYLAIAPDAIPPGVSVLPPLED